jgi:hypothetical protein
VVGQKTNEEIRFHVGNDGAMGGIVKDGFDNKPDSVTDQTKVSSYYTVTLTQVLDRMKAPSVIDYFCLDIEGKNRIVAFWTRSLAFLLTYSLLLSLSLLLGAEFYALENFAFDRYSFQILTVERPKPDLVKLLNDHGYQNMCTISNFGETLWVSKAFKSTLDFTKLPSDCRKDV